MAKKRVTIGKSNGTSNSFEFNIPETLGTYRISFTRSDGTVLNAGNVVVNTNVNTYKLTFGLSNGQTLNAGTFTTPAVSGWVTLFSGSAVVKSNSPISIPGLRANTKTRITFNGWGNYDKYDPCDNYLGNFRFNINDRTAEVSSNGKYSGENTGEDWDTMERWAYGFDLVVGNNVVTISTRYDATYCQATIYKIEQYF